MRTRACAARWREWLPLFSRMKLPRGQMEWCCSMTAPGNHLCSVLRGAIEGAAERYGERVRVIERTCMKRGAMVCRFQARFFAPSPAPQEHLKTPEQVARQKAQKELTDLVLSLLPDAGMTDGLTLADLQGILRQHQDVRPRQLRPAVLLEALNQLQFAGLVMSTASQQGDDFARRRYWRVQT